MLDGLKSSQWPQEIVLGLGHTLAEHQMLWKSDDRICYQFLLWHQYECEGLQSDSEECRVSLWHVKLSREHFCQLNERLV